MKTRIIRIETDRLILRCFKVSDAENMYNNWAKHSTVTRFLTWSPHKNIQETKKILRKWHRSYIKKNFFNLAIELKEIEQVIGSISVVHERCCWHNGKKVVIEKEIGYCLGENWWGKGIMSEALTAVIDYIFTHTDATRIVANHAFENLASGKVMKKAGMQYEGTLRQYGTSNYGKQDVCVYSILRPLS